MARSPTSMVRLGPIVGRGHPHGQPSNRGAGHAVNFDATTTFVQLIADTITSSRQGAQISREYFDAPVRLLGEHPRHRP